MRGWVLAMLVGCSSGGVVPDAGPPDLAGAIVVVIPQNGTMPPCVPQTIANPDRQCSIVLASSSGVTTLPRCESSSPPQFPCGTISASGLCPNGVFGVDFGAAMPPPGTTAEGVCTP
jgi:hypothetical protein